MEGVEKLLKKSLENLQKIYIDQKKGNEKSDSRLLFPHLRKNKKGERILRVSEQEAVFLFAKEIENDKEYNYYYAVEVPTGEQYLLNRGEPVISGKGSSGNIDVCIYKDSKTKNDPICLIEFKEALQGNRFGLKDNPEDKKYKLGFVKDFLRLRYDNNKPEKNYFVHIIENCTDEKRRQIRECYENSFYYIDEYYPEAHKQDLKKIEARTPIKIFVCLLQESNIEKIIEIENKNDLDKLWSLERKV